MILEKLKAKYREASFVALTFITILFFWTLHTSSFVAEDSFFYLVVAENIVEVGRQTFNNVFPTNGFHPAWLYVLTSVEALGKIFGVTVLGELSRGVFISIIPFVIGVIITIKIISEWNCDWRPSFVILSVYLGALGLLYSESHLHFMALSVACYVIDKSFWERDWGFWIVGAVCSLLFLSRLDSIFFIVSFLVVLLYKENLYATLKIGLVFTILSLPYLLSNLYFFGGLTPISGFLKSSFPHISYSHFSGDVFNLSFTLSGYQVYLGLFPILFGILSTCIVYKKGYIGKYIIVPILLFGSIMHALYIILFTAGYTRWYWYYVMPIFLLSVTLPLILKIIDLKLYKTPMYAYFVFLPMLVAILFYKVSGKNMSKRTRHTVKILKSTNINGESILVSEFPGRAAYYTEASIIPADMLMSSRNHLRNMLSSDNSFCYIFDKAKQSKLPLGYVLLNGGEWLVRSKSSGKITYYSPKVYNKEKRIGVIPDRFIKRAGVSGPVRLFDITGAASYCE